MFGETHTLLIMRRSGFQNIQTYTCGTCMLSKPCLYLLVFFIFSIIVLQTNLQREREFTALLIDPAALMDKNTDDNKALLLSHRRMYTLNKINQTETHLQLLDDFKELRVLTKKEKKRQTDSRK